MLDGNKNIIQVSKNTGDSKAWYYYDLDVMDHRIKVRQRNWCILGTVKSQKTKTEILLSWLTSKNCVMVSESLTAPSFSRNCYFTTLARCSLSNITRKPRAGVENFIMISHVSAYLTLNVLNINLPARTCPADQHGCIFYQEIHPFSPQILLK